MSRETEHYKQELKKVQADLARAQAECRSLGQQHDSCKGDFYAAQRVLEKLALAQEWESGLSKREDELYRKIYGQ